ncbi:S41 family peptidase [Pedobacter insulae]|uniref:PDZ domain-containing protein n=1 Tax=Pedobacter insulae TaxID=414048 RepID=A0A1I2VHM2_9SPHI|nr:S41 family peptidase [Pedobacter insulae]SFG88650.1 PDZ domain-containing protein [Pedobacter insulae]
MKLNYAFLFLVLCIGFTSCKRKPKVDPEPKTTRADLSRDSIYLYAKEIYLWNDAIPTYDAFNPRKFTSESSDLSNYEKELIALTQYKINPATGSPYEYFANGTDSKYSYIIDKADENPIAFVPTERSSVDLEGNGNDFGIKLTAYTYPDKSFELMIMAVYENSPADKAGLIRSNKITKINGTTVGTNYDTQKDLINTAINNNIMQLEYVNFTNGVASGSPVTVNLIKNSYKSSPFYATKVFTAGAKKIGYLAYARFSTLSNSQQGFTQAFNTFSTGGVTDLIIDLRYNGGGYVNTAQYLINQIAPASATGKVMFTEHYNTLMQANNANILKNQPYTDGTGKIVYENGRMLTLDDVDYSVAGNTERYLKAGPLNTTNTISNIVFIVSGNTASASELVINSLKPYMTVKVLGTKTYGKPVGFFPITIENKYKVFYSLFQTKNSLGQGEYFDGMTPDVVDLPGDDFYDDPYHNFGDSQESYLKKSIALLAPGVVITTLGKTAETSTLLAAKQRTSQARPMAGGNEFVGMIENRPKLKQ